MNTPHSPKKLGCADAHHRIPSSQFHEITQDPAAVAQVGFFSRQG
jgi:hypothetical protein